jgi:hypothetical protein
MNKPEPFQCQFKTAKLAIFAGRATLARRRVLAGAAAALTLIEP